ncbi:phenylalanine--tRNA ligase subunit beta [Granulicella sp. dw_53]|uniref:phenylalanine--tRNA ligase subunit beta n=1 Tax=Granulicella sp. dw_53 TaxID=2719792 RepID=UPI001BD3B7CD|nr:phenylalanine--tRNA ligase subunit beta [Granulicella sp. dw_53]
MKILTNWLRTYVPNIPADDLQLADDLTLRGIAVEGVHHLGPNNGHLFEMDITTNRVDAMNHYGIAREAATIYNLPLLPLLPETASQPPASTPFPVRIEAPHLCGRFTAQVLRNITISPSTGSIADYFGLLAQKQISNAVDASNFVLLGMGHPTHAFDLDKLEGGIVVRLARQGEKLKLLDGIERILEADDLVVADEVKALGLAGVMGGWDSMITPQTKNILVEAAWFDQASIRRSARRHGLHTDASHRFERGADFNACPTANALVSQLILQSGGSLEGGLVDILIPEIAARTASRPPIQLSVLQVQRHLGTTLSPEGLTQEIVVQYLTALGCELTPLSSSKNDSAAALDAFNRDPQVGGAASALSSVSTIPEDLFSVQLPSWRLDLEREIDLIEEVARVYGYNRFANTLPTPGIVIAHPTSAAEAAVRTRLLALGFSESISSTFASQSDSDLFSTAGKGTIAMENPLSDEASLLRPSLVPGMVTMLAHNLNRDVKDVRLFEQGHIFTGDTNEVYESSQLSLGLTGASSSTTLHSAQDAPFFELKGVIESVISLFTLTGGSAALSFTLQAPDWLQPGRSATVLLNNTPIGGLGELTRAEAQRRKLRQPIYLAQLDLAVLYALPLRQVTAHDLSRFQAVERDFSFTFPDATQWHTIAAAIHALAIPELQRLAPVEIFRDAKGKAVAAGHYSLLLRAVFQSHERTLNEDELSHWQSQIIATLTHLGGSIRA